MYRGVVGGRLKKQLTEVGLQEGLLKLKNQVNKPI